MKILLLWFFFLYSIKCFSQIDPSTITHLYQEKPKPIIIYFYTEWCAVCKIQDLEIDNYINSNNDLKNEVYFLKIDAETEDEIDFMYEKFKSNTTTTKKSIHNFVYAFINPKQVNFPLWIIIDHKLNLIDKYTGLIKKNQFNQLIKTIKESNK